MPTGAIDIKELGKQVKSFADRKGELAQTLANLPLYHAYCAIPNEQGITQQGEVKLTEPIFRKATKEQIRVIEENSREYMADWDKIRKDIEKRQAIIQGTLQQTPPETKPGEAAPIWFNSRFGIFYVQ